APLLNIHKKLVGHSFELQYRLVLPLAHEAPAVAVCNFFYVFWGHFCYAGRMQKWEYMTLVDLGREHGNFPVLEECNKLGSEGWELVGVTTETEKTHSMLFFKRPNH